MNSPRRFFPVLVSVAVSTVLFYMYAAKQPVGASVLPVQHLQLNVGPNGPTIRDLFGRFPSVPSSCSIKANTNIAAKVPSTVALAAGQAQPTACNSPGCPYGSTDYMGCITNRKARPVAICSTNNSCTTWGCPMVSQGTCCEICVWNPGTNCDSCTTNGYC